MGIFDRFNQHIGRHENYARAQKSRLPLDEQIADAQHSRRQLRRAGRVWDTTVPRLLAKLARAKWPAQNQVRILPDYTTRIRRRDEPEKITWWVEHDLPPYNSYRCAAYFIDLEVGDDSSCVLTVRSEKGSVRLEQPTALTLERTLAEALHTPPAIIPRQMGDAWD